MTKYYWNNETDDIENVDTIRSDYYEVFGQDYDTFDDYLNACMSWNNGALVPVPVRLKDVKRRLNEKLMLARKYGYEEYADELADLLAEMDRLSRYTRERA